MAQVWAVAGAKNKYLAYWSPLVATVALVTTGAELTGPSMNPAFVSPSAPVTSCNYPLCHCANRRQCMFCCVRWLCTRSAHAAATMLLLPADPLLYATSVLKHLRPVLQALHNMLFTL